MPYSLELSPEQRKLLSNILESIAVSAKTTGSMSIQLFMLNKLSILPESHPFHITLAILGLTYAGTHGGTEFLKHHLIDLEKRAKLSTICAQWQQAEQGLDTNILTFRFLYILLKNILNASPLLSICVSLPFSAAIAVYITKNRDPLGRPRRAAQEINDRRRNLDTLYLADPDDSPAPSSKAQKLQLKLNKIANALSYGIESAGVAGLVVFTIEELAGILSPTATIVSGSIVGAAGTWMGWQLESRQEQHMQQIVRASNPARPAIDDDSQLIWHKINLDAYTHCIELTRTTDMTFLGLSLTYTALEGIFAPQNKLSNDEYYVPNAYLILSFICAILVALNSIYRLRNHHSSDEPANPTHSRTNSDGGSHTSDPHSEPLLSSEERDEKSPTNPGDYTPPKHHSDESSISPRSTSQQSDEMKEVTEVTAEQTIENSM